MKIVAEKISSNKKEYKSLSNDRWFKLSLIEQLANVGGEVERAILWKKKNANFSEMAVNRALELLWLTIDDKKNKIRLKEITRLYEAINDYFYGDNVFNSSDSLWQKYFYNFAYAVRNKIV